MKTTVEHLKVGNDIIGIRVTNTKGETFTIPIFDVRRSEDERSNVEATIKDNNARIGSKFLKPSYSWHGYSYNQSHK